MKIKQSKQLQPGDIIKWRIKSVTFADHETTRDDESSNRYHTAQLQVEKVYSHHVDFRILEPPYLRKNIQNADLFLHGIYKSTDCINPFAVRYEDE